MAMEGQLTIVLDISEPKVKHVTIRSSRPFSIINLFKGKSAEQCLELVPLLYNICANAQAYAAHSAIQNALGIAPDIVADNARQIVLMLETVREHSWRILLDWPKFVGSQADKSRLVNFMRLNQKFKPLLFKNGRAFQLDSRVMPQAVELSRQFKILENLINESIFLGQLQSFLTLETESQLLRWMAGNDALSARVLLKLYKESSVALGQNTIQLLPELDTNDVCHMPKQISYSQAPTWRDNCYETGPLNRQQSQPLVAELINRYGNGLLSRIVARLFEIASTPCHLTQKLSAIEADNFAGGMRINCCAQALGVAQVQAARGLLIHRVELVQDRIGHYQIVAPTEWNFHPNGVVAASLKQLQTSDKNVLLAQATCLINAIDPCVKFVIATIDENEMVNRHA